MRIGSLAGRTGVSSKTIRYYESIGLIQPADRGENGYRSYGDPDVAILHFIQRARKLGFSVKKVSELLELWYDRNRASASVKALALAHVQEVETKIAELQSLRATLIDLTERCHGDDRPNCPILDNLADL
ncbi:MAG: Cu(I)-responsive transcriptional regulator [Rhodospirillales bacterium]|nr:Cu(I)-responsive transcriptional regulator [Rhodospirillales bacterium]